MDFDDNGLIDDCISVAAQQVEPTLFDTSVVSSNEVDSYPGLGIGGIL